MSGNRGRPTNDGYRPIPTKERGYTPRPSSGSYNVEGGYRPTTTQGPSSAPASVPKQPSSVQSPKK